MPTNYRIRIQVLLSLVLAFVVCPVWAQGTLPPITATTPEGKTLPAGWSFWAQVTDGASTRTVVEPQPYIHALLGNAGQWQVGVDKTIDVTPGQTWTVTAVLAGRNIGWLSPNAGAAVNLIGYQDDGGVNWALAERWTAGSFDWKTLSATVTIPQGISRITPRIYGMGGGEIFIAALDLAQRGDAAPLAAPTFTVPKEETPIPIRLTAQADKPHAVYLPGDTISWALLPHQGAAQPMRYVVADADGVQCAEGTVTLHEPIRFTPPSPGYYAVTVTGALPGPGIEYAMCMTGSAIVVPQPKNWAPGCNPFGGQSGPQELYSRLGISWTRATYYDIITGSHNELPKDLVAFANAWEQKMRKGLDPLTINTIEVWNEPTNELKKGWAMEQLVAVVKATREGAHRVDPTAKIAVNLEWPGIYDTFHQTGGAGTYDVMTPHPYSMSLWGNPPSTHGPEADGLLDLLAQFRDSLKKAGLDNVQIWSTEYGWPTAPGYGWSTTELDQARYLVRSSLLQLAGGLQRVNPFRLTDVPFWDPMNSSFGMIRANDTPKPSLAAYAILAQTVNDLPYVGRVDLGHNVAALLFGNARETVLTLWRPDAESTLTLTLPGGTVEQTSLFGSKEERKSPFVVTAGPSPVYLHVTASPTAAANMLGKPLLTGVVPVTMFDFTK